VGRNAAGSAAAMKLFKPKGINKRAKEHFLKQTDKIALLKTQ
jgi:hypothetical protein